MDRKKPIKPCRQSAPESFPVTLLRHMGVPTLRTRSARSDKRAAALPRPFGCKPRQDVRFCNHEKRAGLWPAQGVELLACDQYVPSASTTTRRLGARHAISSGRFLSPQDSTGSASPRPVASMRSAATPCRPGSRARSRRGARTASGCNPRCPADRCSRRRGHVRFSHPARRKTPGVWRA